MPPPSISIVAAATHDSPTLPGLIEALEPQLARVGGELLIADGSKDGLSGVDTAVHLPGASVFALRAAAATGAKGTIIAFTEDHCLPAPDWCEAMLRAHAEHPRTAAIGGGVANGSTSTALDWANYLLTFAPFAPPTPQRHRRTAPPANLSMKRESLEEYELTPGRLETEIVPHFNRVGHLLLDDRVVVHHIQSHGLAERVAAHFHNGRSSAGLPRRSPPASEIVVRVARSTTLPWRLLAELAHEAQRRERHRRVLVRAAPLILLLACCHAAGEVVGAIAGPGASPEKLEAPD